MPIVEDFPENKSTFSNRNSNPNDENIESYVFSTWTDTNLQNAALQYVNAIKLTYSSENHIATHEAITKARSCFLALHEFWDITDATELIHQMQNTEQQMGDIRKMLLDTPERTEAYLRYNSSLSGKRISIPVESVHDCEFTIK